MNRKLIASFAILTSAAITGCKRPAPAPVAVSMEPTIAEIPSSMDGDTKVVHVTADDTMHFNGNRFTVKTGQSVRIEFINKGHHPKEEMAHNFVIVKPGTNLQSFNLQAAQSKTNYYIPADQKDSIFAFTPGLAGPGETVVTEFAAPAPGEYPFLCNFPGHYAAGMHGTMTVIP